MKRLLVIFTCCSPLVLSPATSFALDSTIVTAQETPVYKKYGPIHYDESLWSVSKKLRPNKSVSIQQTLVAIYKLNPDAFFTADINHLIEDSVINVPTDSFIKKQSHQDAINLINQYSDKSQKPTRSVVVTKSENALFTKPPSVSEKTAVAGQPSSAVSPINKKYFPDPKDQANNSSVSLDSVIESGNDSQNNSPETESTVQQPVINSAGVNKQEGSWLTGSLKNLLLVAGSILFLITFVLSLIFRR